MAPIVERSAQAANVPVIDLQIDDDPETASALRVRSVPTLIAFFDGEETGRVVGAQTEATVAEFVESARSGRPSSTSRSSTTLWLGRLGAGVLLAVVGLFVSSLALAAIGAGIAIWGVAGARHA